MFERLKGWWQKRVMPLVWPDRGFGRVWRFIMLKLSRLKATPHQVALGFAAGAAISFTPLLGLHILLALGLTFALRGSLIAAALGTLVGNPATFPAIFALTYGVGSFLGSAPDAERIAQPVEGLTTAGYMDVAPVKEVIMNADLPAISATGGWWGGLDAFWPAFSTMLIGSIPVVLLAFIGFYLFARTTVSSLVAVRSAKVRSRLRGH